MKHQIPLVRFALAVLFSVVPVIEAGAKDINLGWSGQGSWSTLPYIVEDLLAVGTFRLKEKPKTALSLQSVRDWSFGEKAKR
jgi:hypothetical protein